MLIKYDFTNVYKARTSQQFPQRQTHHLPIEFRVLRNLKNTCFFRERIFFQSCYLAGVLK